MDIQANEPTANVSNAGPEPAQVSFQSAKSNQSLLSLWSNLEANSGRISQKPIQPITRLSERKKGIKNLVLVICSTSSGKGRVLQKQKIKYMHSK